MQQIYKTMAICLAISPTISCVDSQKVTKALPAAYKDIERYFATASDADKTRLAQYLTYYRSEGHYQAVTPAPYELRKSLSAPAQALFKRLVYRARPFTRAPRALPGASRLTKEGEEYYERIIAFFNDCQKRTQTAKQL